MDCTALDAALTQYLRPQTFPLGIRLVASEGEIPPRARRPKRDLGIEVAICQSLGIARRSGWQLAVTPEDVCCPLTFIPFGFRAEVPFSAEGHACAGIYTATPEAGAASEAVVPRLPLGRYRAILVSPLARAEFEPQVVAVYGNSAQVMRLVQAALWARGGAIESCSSGRIDCAEVIIRTLLTGQPRYILPCTGDRMFGLTADDEMIFAMPWAWAEEVVAGLEGTHRAGIRYPVPVFMRFQPQFPQRYEELRAALAGAAKRPPSPS